MTNSDLLEQYIPSGHEAAVETTHTTFINACSELLCPMPATHLTTFPRLDEISGGFRPKEFSIFCGSTGAGKTTFMANLSADLLMQDVPHYVASVETGRTDFMKRVMSCLAQEDWNTGDMVALDKLQAFSKKYGEKMNTGKLHLSIYEERFSVETLMADIAYMVKHHGIKIAVIDNLNFFLDVTSVENQIIEMDRVIHTLIEFTKKIPTHIIMIMHPRKTENTRVLSEFDIKGSSTAVQEAYNIFLWNRLEQEKIDQDSSNKWRRELIIRKLRRKGRAIGAKIIFNTKNGVKYDEESAYV